MRHVIAAFVVVLSGCAGEGVVSDTRYDSLGAVKRIVYADHRVVDGKCYRAEQMEDDGRPSSSRLRTVQTRTGSYTVRDDVDACWESETGTIWISTKVGVMVLLHEICHAVMNLAPAECAARFPTN